MSGIIASRAHDIFKCSVMFNPCTNFPFMAVATDIPDWIASEIINETTKWNFSS
jgi:hypothetical protein